MTDATAHFVPDVSHAQRDAVYEVSEDTLLLADSIERDAALLNALKPDACLEIGSGSGYVSAVLAHVLDGRAHCFATDVNAAAARATSLTLAKNPPPKGLLLLFLLLLLMVWQQDKLDTVFCVLSNSEVCGRGADGPGVVL